MEMHAVSKNYGIGDGAVKSIIAGSDIVLISTHGKSVDDIFKSIKSAVEKGIITQERIDASVMKIIEVKLRYNIMKYDNGKTMMAAPSYSADDLKI